MNPTRQSFKFHDIASAIVSTDSEAANTFFATEYQYHQLETTSSSTVSAGEQSTSELPCIYLEFHQRNSSPENFTHHTHKIFARWSYSITISPTNVDIRVNGNETSISMVHHMLLHPTLRYLASGTDNLLLHAGAVVKNNKSMIFTGRGGTGKTTTTSVILASDQGWQIHADDYVFLGNGLTKAYVTRSHLYRDLKRWVPEIMDRLSSTERLKLEVLGLIRKSSREKIKWPVRVEPWRLWPDVKIANTATPAAMLLLDREDIERPELVPVKNLDETTEELHNMNFGEARHFIQLLRKAAALDEQWLSSWKDKERSLISDNVHIIPVYRLVLPLSSGSAKEVQSDLIPILDDLVS